MNKSADQTDVEGRLNRAVRSVPASGDPDRDAAALDAAVRQEFGAPEVPTSWLPRPVQVRCEVPVAWQPFLPYEYPLERVTSRTVKAQLRQLGNARAERRRAAASHISGWPPRPETAVALREAMRDEDAYVRARAALGVAIHEPSAHADVLDSAEGVVHAKPTGDSEWVEEAGAIAVLAAFVAARSSHDETSPEQGH